MRMTAQKAQRYIGVVALLLALFAGVDSYVGQQDDNNRSACQTRVNQDFLAVIKERATISNENTANLNDFVVAFLHSKSNTPAQDQVIINKYLTELARINGELQRATFPSIGNC